MHFLIWELCDWIILQPLPKNLNSGELAEILEKIWQRVSR